MAAQIFDVKNQIKKILPVELDKSASVSFQRDTVVIEWNGFYRTVERPEQKPAELRQTAYRSRQNPFMFATGDELEQIKAEAAQLPAEAKFPIQTKRTCEVWALARARGFQRHATLLFEEAVRCLAWEWTEASLEANSDFVAILYKGSEFKWSWVDLLQEDAT